LSGKQLYEKQNIIDKQFVTDKFSLSEQVLLVKILLEDGSVTTKKIIF